jgi:hypothetical protein
MFDLSGWQKAVQQQLDESRLPKALNRLTSDLFEQAKQKILLSEATRFQTWVRKIDLGQQYVLTLAFLSIRTNSSPYQGVFYWRCDAAGMSLNRREKHSSACAQNSQTRLNPGALRKCDEMWST